MVQLPDVVVEGGVGIEAVVVDGPDGVEGDGLPPVAVDGARAQHLEVLGHVTLWGRRPVGAQEVGEAGAVDGRLAHRVDLRGRLDAGQLENGREHVDGVGELVADRP